MKFYIAARVSKKEEVREIHKLIVSKGHTFSSDWVNEGDIKPYAHNRGKSSSLAERCMKNISSSDVFVLISDETGAGMYTELGIALQSSLKNKNPKIYIIGDYREQKVFFFHPLVRKFQSIEEVFIDLKIS